MKEAKAGSTKKASKTSAKSQTATKQTSAPSKAKSTTPATAAAPESRSVPVVDREPQLPAANGKVGVFGGPKDRGIKPDDKLALPTGPHFVYERARTLNPKSFYCAMRWNYHLEHMSPEEAKRWWANKKIMVTNAKSGASIVVRAVDYGPHENTGLDISLSPGGAEALSVEIGDEVEITFAEPSAKLGPVNE